MSTLVLGSYSYDIVPDVLGDPLTVSVGNAIPSLTGGAGAPSTAPTYGAGSLYIDTTNYAVYVYAAAAWHTIASAAATVTAIAGTANQITLSGSTGSVTVGLASNAIMPGTASLTLPAGTTAQRPATPTDGMLRYNTDEEVLEGYSSPYSTTISPVAAQRTALYRKRRTWFDEFMTGAVTTTGVAVYGEINWTISNSSGTPSVSILTGIADHPGILTIGTAAAASNNVRLHMANVPATQIILANQVEYFAFLIRIPTITSIILRMGLFTDLTTTTTGATYTSATAGVGSVYFTFDTGVSTALQFFTSSTNVTSAAVNTVTIAANTWYLVEAFYDGTKWTPVVNGVAYTAQTANIPTGAVNVGVMFANTAAGAAAKTLQIDYFSMYTRELGARYP